ncbi:hypothetical protein Tco_1052084 [Tanacetum coccineum]
MKKVTPLFIPYGRFSKVIIYYLASNNNIHRRPDSAVHHTVREANGQRRGGRFGGHVTGRAGQVGREEESVGVSEE